MFLWCNKNTWSRCCLALIISFLPLVNANAYVGDVINGSINDSDGSGGKNWGTGGVVEDAPAEVSLVIRFNQEKVYFQNPVRQMIYNVAKTKPNAKYELLSVVPKGKKTSANGKIPSENIQNVIAVFEKYGVYGNRISTKTEESDSVQNQEVRISYH